LRGSSRAAQPRGSSLPLTRLCPRPSRPQGAAAACRSVQARRASAHPASSTGSVPQRRPQIITSLQLTCPTSETTVRHRNAPTLHPAPSPSRSRLGEGGQGEKRRVGGVGGAGTEAKCAGARSQDGQSTPLPRVTNNAEMLLGAERDERERKRVDVWAARRGGWMQQAQLSRQILRTALVAVGGAGGGSEFEHGIRCQHWGWLGRTSCCCSTADLSRCILPRRPQPRAETWGRTRTPSPRHLRR